jgi:hypothetical protein
MNSLAIELGALFSCDCKANSEISLVARVLNIVLNRLSC